jgi:hypothetical protein
MSANILTGLAPDDSIHFRPAFPFWQKKWTQGRSRRALESLLLYGYSLLGMTVIVRAYLSQEHRIALFALPVGGCARTVAYSGVIIRGCEDGDAAV